jgi:hypothetical protein
MSGLSRTPGKRVWDNIPTGVRIPLSPPKPKIKPVNLQAFFTSGRIKTPYKSIYCLFHIGLFGVKRCQDINKQVGVLLGVLLDLPWGYR